jgi:3-oxoadipate enol-lactonase
MPFAQTSDHVRLHYEVRGHGPLNLIFLHGNGGPAGKLWDKVIAHLDETLFRNIVLDYRGFGKSDYAKSGYNWENFGRDVLTAADEVGAERFVPVGFSFGGKLACFMAAKYSYRVPAQALVAPVGPGTASLSRELGLQICREARDWKKVRPFFRNLWFGPSANEELVEACCKAVAEIPQAVLEASLEMALWTSLVPEIGKLDLPSLLVTGNEDPAYGLPYQMEQMFPFLNRRQTVTVNSGHFIPLEQPVQLARLLSTFVSEIQSQI